MHVHVSRFRQIECHGIQHELEAKCRLAHVFECIIKLHYMLDKKHMY